ncbi:MAG TPA: hypothetical protein VL860_08535, partial [Planctomycetota bacterium]|nr:hypothetical protein [Planctomycetota bacterium]
DMSDQKEGGDDYQLKQDADHLKILMIIWYVIAGLQLLIGICAGAYIALIGAAVGATASQNGGGAPAGAVAICIGVGYFVILLTFAFLSFMVARSLAARKRHMFCLVIAGISCLSIPIGTILGIFTIIVLLRPTVKKAFGVAA